MSKPYPNIRTVGLTVGYVNKTSDDSDHPHKHLGQAMCGVDDTSDGRVIILTKNDDGSIAITDFRKHDDQILQDFTVEHLTNVDDSLWDRINMNVTTAIHPGPHGYADDSNIMVQDFNIVREQMQQARRLEESKQMTTITANEDNFLVQAKFTNNDTKPSEVRDLVYDTLQDHLNGDVKSSRIFIASEMNDGSVHISHLSTTNNQTRSELTNYMFTNGAAMYSKMAAGFDAALDHISNGDDQPALAGGVVLLDNK